MRSRKRIFIRSDNESGNVGVWVGPSRKSPSAFFLFFFLLSFCVVIAWVRLPTCLPAKTFFLSFLLSLSFSPLNLHNPTFVGKKGHMWRGV